MQLSIVKSLWLGTYPDQWRGNIKPHSTTVNTFYRPYLSSVVCCHCHVTHCELFSVTFWPVLKFFLHHLHCSFTHWQLGFRTFWSFISIYLQYHHIRDCTKNIRGEEASEKGQGCCRESSVTSWKSVNLYLMSIHVQHITFPLSCSVLFWYKLCTCL